MEKINYQSDVEATYGTRGGAVQFFPLSLDLLIDQPVSQGEINGLFVEEWRPDSALTVPHSLTDHHTDTLLTYVNTVILTQPQRLPVVVGTGKQAPRMQDPNPGKIPLPKPPHFDHLYRHVLPDQRKRQAVPHSHPHYARNLEDRQDPGSIVSPVGSGFLHGDHFLTVAY